MPGGGGKLPISMAQSAIDFLDILRPQAARPGWGRRVRAWHPLPSAAAWRSSGTRASRRRRMLPASSASAWHASWQSCTCRCSQVRSRIPAIKVAGRRWRRSPARVTGDPEHRTPEPEHRLRLRRREAILLMLKPVGIAASSGSACTPGSQASHVYLPFHVPLFSFFKVKRQEFPALQLYYKVSEGCHPQAFI